MNTTFKTITREDFQKIIADYGHRLSCKVPVVDKYGCTELREVINEGMVYNPYGLHRTQVGMSSNASNASAAMKFIKDEAHIYSDVFTHIRGSYSIVD